MSNPAPESMAAAALRELTTVRARWPKVDIVLGAATPPFVAELLRPSFGARVKMVGARSKPLVVAERRRPSAGPAVVIVAHLGVDGATYEAIRDGIGRSRRPVKLLALDGGALTPTSPGFSAPIEDLGMMSTIPSMTVVAPADADSARAALRSILEIDGPAYLRLATGHRPVVSKGWFTLGVWPALREGNDLTIIAVGALVARAVGVADELSRMGLSIRVLDAASVKPADARSVLRAASETGALVVLEDHSALAGVGSQVAALVSAERPVRVVRVSIPDLFTGPAKDLAELDRFGLSQERVVETCLDILRQRGKV